MEDGGGGWVRSAIERTGDSLDGGRKTEVETGHRDVQQVRAHIADGADAPIDPAAPIEGMIDGVIVDAGANAEEEIPGERLRNGIIHCHSGGETSVNDSGIPLESVK